MNISRFTSIFRKIYDNSFFNFLTHILYLFVYCTWGPLNWHLRAQKISLSLKSAIKRQGWGGETGGVWMRHHGK